jgi:hypothetical protein
MADSMARQKTFESLRPQAGGNSTVSFAYTPTTQMYANDMNQVAFRFYKITDSIPLLKKVLLWSERSLAFYESAASLDTYARLLYKTGDREKAIVYQRKAVEDARKKNLPGRELEDVLERMIKGENKLE